MKKVGLLGGTFDPIHIGHVVAADQALYHLELDEVWFVPAKIPPHKMNNNITPANHRLEMVKRVVKQDNRFSFSAIELEMEGPSYTLSTIKLLNENYPDHQFYFIIGEDMIDYLPKWYGINELIHLVTFIGLERPGYSYKPSNEYEKEIYDKVKIIPMPQLEISSSLIREWFKLGRRVRYLVPQPVEEYIREHQLYGARF